MKPRIENLPHCNNRLHSVFLQCILELPVDELNAVAEVVGIGAGVAPSLQRALETVEDRQKILDDVRRGKFAEVLLLPHRPLTRIIEFRLQTRQAVKKRVALGLQPFRFRSGSLVRCLAGNRDGRLFFSFFRRRKLPLHIQIPFSLSLSLTHTAGYSDSFKSLSNSRAMYDTADMVC